MNYTNIFFRYGNTGPQLELGPVGLKRSNSAILLSPYNPHFSFDTASDTTNIPEEPVLSLSSVSRSEFGRYSENELEPDSTEDNSNTGGHSSINYVFDSSPSITSSPRRSLSGEYSSHGVSNISRSSWSIAPPISELNFENAESSPSMASDQPSHQSFESGSGRGSQYSGARGEPAFSPSSSTQHNAGASPSGNQGHNSRPGSEIGSKFGSEQGYNSPIIIKPIPKKPSEDTGKHLSPDSQANSPSPQRSPVSLHRKRSRSFSSITELRREFSTKKYSSMIIDDIPEKSISTPSSPTLGPMFVSNIDPISPLPRKYIFDERSRSVSDNTVPIMEEKLRESERQKEMSQKQQDVTIPVTKDLLTSTLSSSQDTDLKPQYTQQHTKSHSTVGSSSKPQLQGLRAGLGILHSGRRKSSGNPSSYHSLINDQSDDEESGSGVQQLFIPKKRQSSIAGPSSGETSQTDPPTSKNPRASIASFFEGFTRGLKKNRSASGSTMPDPETIEIEDTRNNNADLPKDKEKSRTRSRSRSRSLSLSLSLPLSQSRSASGTQTQQEPSLPQVYAESYQFPSSRSREASIASISATGTSVSPERTMTNESTASTIVGPPVSGETITSPGDASRSVSSTSTASNSGNNGSNLHNLLSKVSNISSQTFEAVASTLSTPSPPNQTTGGNGSDSSISSNSATGGTSTSTPSSAAPISETMYPSPPPIMTSDLPPLPAAKKKHKRNLSLSGIQYSPVGTGSGVGGMNNIGIGINLGDFPDPGSNSNPGASYGGFSNSNRSSDNRRVSFQGRRYSPVQEEGEEEEYELQLKKIKEKRQQELEREIAQQKQKQLEQNKEANKVNANVAESTAEVEIESRAITSATMAPSTTPISAISTIGSVSTSATPVLSSIPASAQNSTLSLSPAPPTSNVLAPNSDLTSTSGLVSSHSPISSSDSDSDPDSAISSSAPAPALAPASVPAPASTLNFGLPSTSPVNITEKDFKSTSPLQTKELEKKSSKIQPLIKTEINEDSTSFTEQVESEIKGDLNCKEKEDEKSLVIINKEDTKPPLTELHKTLDEEKLKSDKTSDLGNRELGKDSEEETNKEIDITGLKNQSISEDDSTVQGLKLKQDLQENGGGEVKAGNITETLSNSNEDKGVTVHEPKGDTESEVSSAFHVNEFFLFFFLKV